MGSPIGDLRCANSAGPAEKSTSDLFPLPCPVLLSLAWLATRAHNGHIYTYILVSLINLLLLFNSYGIA